MDVCRTACSIDVIHFSILCYGVDSLVGVNSGQKSAVRQLSCTLVCGRGAQDSQEGKARPCIDAGCHCSGDAELSGCDCEHALMCGAAGAHWEAPAGDGLERRQPAVLWLCVWTGPGRGVAGCEEWNR